MNSQPVAYYREGGTTPHLQLVFYLRSAAFDWLSQYYEYTVAKPNGGGAESKLFITLTRGMDEPSYILPSHSAFSNGKVVIQNQNAQARENHYYAAHMHVHVSIDVRDYQYWI